MKNEQRLDKIEQSLIEIKTLLTNHLYHHNKALYTIIGALVTAIIGLLFK